MTASAPAPHESRYRLTVRLLVIAASVLAFLSIFTTWVDRQALNTDDWVNTSGRLLEDKAISDAVANYAVDQLFASVNVPKLLSQQLPKPVKGFSGPLASGLREFAVRAAQTALQTSRLQALWRDANRTAHVNLLAILENRSGAVSTKNGTVTLDLRPIVGQLASEIGIERQVSQNLPPDVAQLRIVKSNQLGTAQTISQLVKGLALVFSLGTLVLFGLAAYLAAGRRWLVVFGYGIGLLIAGIAALALRQVGSTVVINALVHTESVRTPANHAYSIGTDLLSSIATTAIAYGVLFVVASYLASPAGSAVALRRMIAPSFRDRPAIIWAIFGGAVLIFLIASPPSSNRELISTLALIALAGIGFAALGRKTSREYPDALPGEWRARAAARIRELGEGGAQRMRTALDDLGGRREEDARLDRLARLGELKEKGVLTEEEFQAEKQRQLATPGEDVADTPGEDLAEAPRKQSEAAGKEPEKERRRTE